VSWLVWSTDGESTVELPESDRMALRIPDFPIHRNPTGPRVGIRVADLDAAITWHPRVKKSKEKSP
jgi:hypothetical protein